MSKQKVEDLKIFSTLSGIIGITKAKCELFKLQGYIHCDFDDSFDVYECLYWSETPQGFDFWNKIANQAHRSD